MSATDIAGLTLAERATDVLPPAAGRATRLGVVRAQGARVWDETGRDYLDFSSGVGVANLGHGHPDVVAAASRQLNTLVHAGHNVSYYSPYVELAERLTAEMPTPSKVFLATTGAEAIDGAIKLCMRATGRSAVIAFRGGFHGRTALATALSSSNADYRTGYGPLLPAVHHLPFPRAFTHNAGADEEDARCLRELEEHLAQVVAPGEVAAIIIEPIQGEGGYLPASTGFLRGLREICTRHGIPLVFDEIQSGFGRTGELFAFQHHDVVPDVLVLAKGIANGMPLSAIVADAELMDRWPAGSHGGTYGGNAVACAAALAVLDQMTPALLARVRELNSTFSVALRAAAERYCGEVDVRGPGLMIGMEFIGEDGLPDTAFVAGVQRRALEDGLILLNCGRDRNTLRLIPPLVISDEDVAHSVDVLRRSIDAELVSRESQTSCLA